MSSLPLFGVLLVVLVDLSWSQIPQRLQIPGAVLVQQSRPQARLRRPQVQQIDPNLFPQPPQRLRRPLQNAVPAPLPPPIREPIRPVFEEVEEQSQPTESSLFDNEVARLTLSNVQDSNADEEIVEPPKPVAFRPERPIPVLRSDVRDIPRPVSRPVPVQNARPVPVANARPIPVQRARPILRQELEDENIPIRKPQSRPVLRQELEEENIPIRKPVPVRQQQPARQPARIPARQYSEDDEDRQKRRKPVVQILRKYRNDNEDGSITWGFENEDGTFKEETLGADCITRGKYGYVDPDGVRREYNYETGLKCDDEELPEELPIQHISPKAQQRRPY